MIWKNKKIRNDKKIRLLYYKNIKNKILNKSILFNQEIKKENKKNNLIKGTKCKIKNLCLLSGKIRSINSKFKISNIFFRKLGLNGNIPGILKSSW